MPRFRLLHLRTGRTGSSRHRESTRETTPVSHLAFGNAPTGRRESRGPFWHPHMFVYDPGATFDGYHVSDGRHRQTGRMYYASNARLALCRSRPRPMIQFHHPTVAPAAHFGRAADRDGFVEVFRAHGWSRLL